jgi:acyl-CoA thioester hydrolase
MSTPFSVVLTVRSYELDPQGHVNGAVYLQYADHAFYECFRAAGAEPDDLLAGGVGPVNLEARVRFLRELRGGDEVLVSCDFVWGDGRTFQVVRELATPGGQPVAEVTTVTGLLDLNQRRLVSDPADRLRSLARNPALLGLSP